MTSNEIANDVKDFLRGYLMQDPARLEVLLSYPDWSSAAAQLLKDRATRFLEVLPDTLLLAIARGDVCLASIARSMAP